jgi:hypothetical protein
MMTLLLLRAAASVGWRPLRRREDVAAALQENFSDRGIALRSQY